MSALVIAVGSGLVGAVAGPLLLVGWQQREKSQVVVDRGRAIMDDLLADRRAAHAAADHARFVRSVRQRAEFLAIVPVRAPIDGDGSPDNDDAPDEDLAVEEWSLDELREWLRYHRNDDPPPPPDDEFDDEDESDDESDDDEPDADERVEEEPADGQPDPDTEPAETS